MKREPSEFLKEYFKGAEYTKIAVEAYKKKYKHTIEYEEHEYAPTFGNGVCGHCPFPSVHPIHSIKREQVKYGYKNPNASWNLPK